MEISFAVQLGGNFVAFLLLNPEFRAAFRGVLTPKLSFKPAATTTTQTSQLTTRTAK